ncbi:MAG: alpha/beta fold hydrolase [Pseudomonadota bacterium]
MSTFSKRIHACLTLMLACSISISALAEGFTREAVERLLSVDNVLQVPVITQVITNEDGDIAWIEQQSAGWNVLLARAPDYKPTQLTAFNDDRGRELALIGFAADDSVIYRYGRWGVNAANEAFTPDVELHQVGSVNRQKTILQDVPRWTARAILGRDGRTLFSASDGTVTRTPLRQPPDSEDLFTVRGRVSSLLLSPDGTRLAFTVDRSGLKRGKYGYVGVYNLSTGELNYIAPGLGIDQNVTWSPDGEQLAFIRFGFEPRTWRFSDHREGAPFYVMIGDPDSGEGEPVFESEPGYGSRFNGFGANGYFGTGGFNSLIWLKNDQLIFPYEKTGWKLLYSVSAGGGEARLLTPGMFEINSIIANADRSGMYYVANTEQDMHRLRLFTLNIDSQLKPQSVPLVGAYDMASPRPRQSVYPLPGGDLALIANSAFSPPQLMIRKPDGSTVKLSSGPDENSELSQILPPAEVLTYTSQDGMQISGVLQKPPTALRTGNNPVIVMAHGGSRSKDYPHWGFSHTRDLLCHYLAGKGYYIFTPNYRSGIGYGLDFREPESYGGRGAGDVQDFIAAARYLKKNLPGINPNRMAIAGYSYGGHLATNAAARSDEYAAVMSYAGVGDWVVEMEKDFGETLQFNIPQRMELEALAHDSSAISKIDEWGNEPVLFVHGDNDGSAAMQQSLELYLALKRRGKVAEALIFPGETHSFNIRAHTREILLRTEQFLEAHMAAQ